MKSPFLSGLAVLSLSCFAGDMLDYALPSLNPVTFEQVKGAEPLVLDDRMVIVIPERSRDHVIPHVMYCGKSNVPYDADIRAAEFAASELSEFIKKSTGVKIPVISEDKALPEGSLPIFVGMSKAAGEYGLDNNGVRPEGFRIINTGKAIGIIGSKRGNMSPSDGAAATLFGVYDFLERFAGVRFYYPDEGIIVQTRDRVVVPPVKYEDYPRFDHRYAHSWTWREFPGNCAPVTAMRWRSGGHGWGTLAVFQHVPSDITLMFDRDADEDCYQLNADGKRSSTIPPVPCYSNAKTFDYIIRAYDDWETAPLARKAMGHAFPNKYALGFGFPDHLIECHCAECLKTPPDKSLMFWEENSEFAGHLAQKLSWKFKEMFPEKRFYYLPYYTYCRAPRKGRFADNTYIRLCMMLGTKMYLDPVIQKKYDQWLSGWEKATGHPVSLYLYTWQDIKPNHPLPYQYYRAWKKFFQDMHKRGVTGAFSCGLDREVSGGLPSNYSMFRVMWNPEYNVEAGVDEMYRLLFGPAYPHMKAIYDRLTDNFEKARAADFKEALNGAPYTAPMISEAEVYEKLCTAKDIKLIKEQLALAEKKLKGADELYEKRYAYFSEPFKLTLKRYEFFQSGASTDIKTLVAAPVSASAAKMKIDGVLDEAAWEEVQNGGMERAEMVLGNTSPDVPTEIKVIRLNSMDPDKSGLLISMRMTEPEMAIRRTDVHPLKLWEGDSIEILFDPTPREDGTRSDNFIQYLVSSAGRLMVNDGKGVHAGEKFKCDFKVHRGEKFWSVEFFVPFNELFRNASPEMRAKAKIVKANFIRNRVLEKKPQRYRFMSRWRTNYGGSNLDVKSFGKVVIRNNSSRFGNPKTLRPTPVSERPVIDGKFDEAAWEDARVETMTVFPVSISNPEPAQESTFRVLRYEHPTDPKQNGYIFGVRMEEPDIAGAILDNEQLHRCDSVEFYMEALAHSPYFMRYIFTMDGRQTHFGDKKLNAVAHKGKNFWNLEFFVPFTSVFSWTHPDPAPWRDNSDIRFNLARHRMNKDTDGRVVNEKSRWNPSTLSSRFDMRGFGKLLLDPANKR